MTSGELEAVQRIAATNSVNPWTEEMFRKEMGSPLSHCYIIENGGDSGDSVLGFLCFRVIAEESELLNLGVHPEHQEKGWGRALMDFYLRFCREAKVKTSYLEVDSLNHRALRLYESLSYQAVGKRKRFYQGKRDALVLKREV